MTVKEIEAKSILRKHKKIDSWFLSRYGMNLYRGCAHNCVYCDGRAEKYQVDGEFGKDIKVKTNAIQLLKKELNPKHRRKPLKPGYVMIGGGVGDSYQPIEQKYQLTKQTLQLLSRYNYPVHILTKSTLIIRDIDLLQHINDTANVIVSFSFSSANDEISRIFEPGVPSPQERLKTISFFKNRGIACGMFLLPVIPFITDISDIMENTMQKAQDAGVDFIVFGGMTLKTGKQQIYFYDLLEDRYPELLTKYHHIYRGDKWGNATHEYYDSIHQTFHYLARKYHIPIRIPPTLFQEIVDENDRVIVILEHLDYLLKLNGKPSPYGYAAYALSKIDKPLSSMKHELKNIKGVGKTTERIILEILETNSSAYYKKMLYN